VSFFFNLNFISTDEKYNYRSERVLDESGISMAPPPHSCLAASAVLPAPPSAISQCTRQCHLDPPASTNTNQTNLSENDGKTSDTNMSMETRKSGIKYLETDEHNTDEGEFFFSISIS
jgi:hypothetical protein